MIYIAFEDLFEKIRYPAGESHLRMRPEQACRLAEAETIVIEAAATGFEDLCEILTADRLLTQGRREARWFVPYFPFARHDRRIDALDGLELELALDLVRPLDLTIVDPHSDVAGLLRHLPQAEVVAGFRRAGAFANEPIVVIPDAGATKKAYEWLGDMPRVQATKRRDVRTGALSGFRIETEGAPDLMGRPCLIVDDICDGGGTFVGLAAELARLGAGPLTLAVSHGLFTRGLEDLEKSFAQIFTYATYPHREGGFQALAYRELYQRGATR